MSGVWVFQNGVVRLEENPAVESVNARMAGRKARMAGRKARMAVAEYLSMSKVMKSWHPILFSRVSYYLLGWERFYDDPDLLQFHRRSSLVDRICLPMEFKQFKSIYMYDIVIKNPLPI